MLSQLLVNQLSDEWWQTLLSGRSSSVAGICCGLLSRFSRLRWHAESSIIVRTQRIWGANFSGNHDTSSAAASDVSNYAQNILKFSIIPIIVSLYSRLDCQKVRSNSDQVTFIKTKQPKIKFR